MSGDNKKNIFIVIVFIVLALLLFYFTGKDRNKITEEKSSEQGAYEPYKLPKPIHYDSLADYAKENSLVSTDILINETNYHFFVAENDKARTRGLSNLSEMSEDQGMLFAFPGSAILGFWMKEMFFDLDIIWLDEDGIIVHIEENLTPETFPIVFKPNESAKYVIELKAGQVTESLIEKGQIVSIPDFLKNNGN